MAINYSKQYCPPSALEDSADDAISVRYVVDLANAMNNYVQHFVSCIWMFATPEESFVSPASGTSEEFIVPLAPRYVDRIYGIARCSFAGALIDSNPVTWTIYASTKKYSGNTGVMDDSYLSHGESASVEFTTSSPTVKHATLSLPHPTSGYGAEERILYFYLTAQADTGGDQAYLTNITMTPEIVT